MAPLVEEMASAEGAEKERVLLMPVDAAHPHHPHVHPLPKTTGTAAPVALPHHHLIPKVLSEVEHKLPRSHGVDTSIVEELDRNWTDVPLTQAISSQKPGAQAQQQPTPDTQRRKPDLQKP